MDRFHDVRLAGDALDRCRRRPAGLARTEAVTGGLEHLRGSALGLRNLTNHMVKSLLETGGFRPDLHPQLR